MRFFGMIGFVLPRNRHCDLLIRGFIALLFLHHAIK
jgi:hypothetical protein